MPWIDFFYVYSISFTFTGLLRIPAFELNGPVCRNKDLLCLLLPKNCFLKTAETCFLQAYCFYLLTLSSYCQLFFALSPDATSKDFTRIQI